MPPETVASGGMPAASQIYDIGYRGYDGPRLGRAYAKTLRARVWMTADHFAHTVHVAANDVAAQTRLRRKRFFQVYALPLFPFGEAGRFQGFPRHVRPITITRQLDHREANTVGGDRITQAYVR